MMTPSTPKNMAKTSVIASWALLTLVLFFSSANTALSQGSCEECENPLVEIKKFRMEGDIPNFEEWIGWDQAQQGGSHFTAQVERSLTAWIEFVNKNPCADFYTIIEHPDGHTTRHGKKTGKAKYEIRSTATIKNSTNGEKAVVRHVVHERIKLEEPITTPNGNLQWFDVKTIFDKAEFVPTIAQVYIEHKLISLKNGEVYDTGSDLIDWVPEPSEEEGSYFYDEDAEIEVDGISYLPNDGLIIGSVPPSTISSSRIHFDKGDVGTTIRMKETPSGLSLEVDDHSRFPPLYKLKISAIKNQFNETMPDNVRVALRVEKGDLKSGELIDGWRVFNTTGGKIRDEVLYRPPQCEEATEDTLEVAGVCDYHDGPETVGKKRFTRIIPNSGCFDATLTITGTLVLNKDESHESTSWDSYKEYRTYEKRIMATVVMSLEMTNFVEMFPFNEIWEYYRPKKRYLTSFNAVFRDTRYEMGASKGHGFETHQVISGYAENKRFTSPMMVHTVILALDRKTRKAKRIFFPGANIGFEFMIQDKMNSKQWSPDSPVKREAEIKHSKKNEEFPIGPVGKPRRTIAGNIYPDLIVSMGDGISFFGGSGTATKNTMGNECYWYDNCSERKTFRWTLSRRKKQD